MSRLSFALVLLVGILAGGLGVSLLQRGPVMLDEAQVRGIVTEVLSAQPKAPDAVAQIDEARVRGIVSELLTAQPKPPVAVAEIDPDRINTLIEQYLMDDPAILQRMSDKLSEAKRVAARQAQKELILANHAAIYEDSGNVILGNPDGDVTLVEMFDYNCGYCRQAVPDLATLMAEDPNLKVILKEFPILSEGSIEAAKVAVMVSEDEQLDYWSFHQKLFSTRGQVGADAALKAAEAVGGSRVGLMIDMNGKLASDAIQKSYALASALDISGTPTYIIGDELIPGAIGLDVLREKIANVRACGSTVCAPTEG